MNPTLFSVHAGTSTSCRGGKALKRIVYHAGRNSIPMIESEQDVQFGDPLIRAEGMVESIFPTSGKIQDIPILSGCRGSLHTSIIRLLYIK